MSDEKDFSKLSRRVEAAKVLTKELGAAMEKYMDAAQEEGECMDTTPHDCSGRVLTKPAVLLGITTLMVESTFWRVIAQRRMGIPMIVMLALAAEAISIGRALADKVFPEKPESAPDVVPMTHVKSTLKN